MAEPTIDDRSCERILTLERAEKINLETGEFPMVLASDGEASDGDILDVAGARYDAQVPLQNSHLSNVKETLGSITNLRKDLTTTPKLLRGLGTVELGGPQALIRQDIAYMVSQGHIRSMSVSWEPIKWRARVNLPSDHPAYVNADTEKSYRKRYGLLFDQWRVKEGSLVAVPSDKQALIGRADEVGRGAVADFYRSWAETLPEVEAPALPAETALAVFGAQVREYLQAGVPIDELLKILDGHRTPTPEMMPALLEGALAKITALETRLGEVESREIVPGAPAAPITPGSPSGLAALVQSVLKNEREHSLAKLRATLARVSGKVE
jgi:hypothetical protein